MDFNTGLYYIPPYCWNETLIDLNLQYYDILLYLSIDD